MPKYRDPKTGKTWLGRGIASAWVAKLRDKGLLDTLLIDHAQAAPKDAAAKPAKKQAAVKKAATAKKQAAAKSTPAAKKVPPGEGCGSCEESRFSEKDGPS